MKSTHYEISFRIPERLHQEMLEDLLRPHSFAHERVGFLHTKSELVGDLHVIILATEYIPVEDDHYIDDRSVGAKINSLAIRSAMQRTLIRQGGCFHVHLHDHRGTPYPSRTDKAGLPGVVESLTNIAPKQANGFLILSNDSFYTSIKVSKSDHFVSASQISVIGKSSRFHFSAVPSKKRDSVYDRQSFLGETSQALFERICVGLIGYGGGGSHIGQQLAHLGVKNLIIYDNDKVEDTNLNRLVGATHQDVKKSSPKTSVAKRLIQAITPSAKVIAVNSRWQQEPGLLKTCNVVFGCVDSYLERQQLEAECRRYLIPYIDIGMDVHRLEEGFSISGQVLLSMPGGPCMQCFQFLTQNKLAQEAAKYGNIGGRPQVIWPNGVLASTAIGVFVNLITNWTSEKESPDYLAYDGNTATIQVHPRTKYVPTECSHYPLDHTGPVIFNRL